ncbi:MAG: putative iron-regulated membrane protein [Parvibaculaceae bacterium]|jgi:uncharacterized iron-regulated membrane protein
MTVQRKQSTYYNLIWRWHFYAGLCVAPFLLILSLTGSIYLFNDEINDVLYPELRFAEQAGASLPMSQLVDAVQTAYPGSTVTRIYSATAPDRTTELFVTTAAGESLRAFVDPVSATFLGSYVYETTLIGLSDQIHGSLLLGDFGDAIVELAACWTLVMIISGLYLWFPRTQTRTQKSGNWWPRLQLRGRAWWKDIHKITGLYTAVLIVFLVITGLPWATVWGSKILTPLTNAVGLGYPDGTRRPLGVARSAHHHNLPWTLQQAPVPESDDTSSIAPLPLDQIIDIVHAQGMPVYRLSMPQESKSVYMAYTYPNQPEGQRTLHIDRYSGEVLGDIRFEDYGGVAKAVEWGVAIHMGNYFGRSNQILMLVPCLASILLVISGIVMWWRRKPEKGLGAPVYLQHAPLSVSLALTLVVLMVLFPLFGGSVILILLVEKIAAWGRRRYAAG